MNKIRTYQIFLSILMLFGTFFSNDEISFNDLYTAQAQTNVGACEEGQALKASIDPVDGKVTYFECVDVSFSPVTCTDGKWFSKGINNNEDCENLFDVNCPNPDKQYLAGIKGGNPVCKEYFENEVTCDVGESFVFINDPIIDRIRSVVNLESDLEGGVLSDEKKDILKNMFSVTNDTALEGKLRGIINGHKGATKLNNVESASLFSLVKELIEFSDFKCQKASLDCSEGETFLIGENGEFNCEDLPVLESNLSGELANFITNRNDETLRGLGTLDLLRSIRASPSPYYLKVRISESAKLIHLLESFDGINFLNDNNNLVSGRRISFNEDKEVELKNGLEIESSKISIQKICSKVTSERSNKECVSGITGGKNIFSGSVVGAGEEENILRADTNVAIDNYPPGAWCGLKFPAGSQDINCLGEVVETECPNTFQKSNIVDPNSGELIVVTCVKQLVSCPSGQYLNVAGTVCGTNCPDGLLNSSGNGCVSVCPALQFKNISNTQCIDSCPIGVEFIDDRQCKVECPQGKVGVEGPVQNGEQKFLCKSECPTEQPLLRVSQNKCVESCAAEEKLSSDRTKCLNGCPEGKYLNVNGNACNNFCNAEFINENQCQHRCPQGKIGVKGPIQNNGQQKYVCEDSCRSDSEEPYRNVAQTKCIGRVCDAPFLDGNQCLPSCPQGKIGVERGQYGNLQRYVCEDNCRSDSSEPYRNVTETKCVGTCNTEFIDGNQCRNSCPQGKIGVFNSTKNKYICEDNCPSSGDKYRNSAGEKCTSTCPGELIPTSASGSNQCVTSCGSGGANGTYQRASTNKCTDTCRGEFIPASGTQCVTSCGSGGANGTYEKVGTNECTNTCEGEKIPVSGTQCVTSCGSGGVNGTYEKASTNECTDTCSGEFKPFSGDRCVTSCRGSNADGSNRGWIKAGDNQCVHGCNNEENGKYNSGEVGRSVWQCVSTCEPGFTSLYNWCIDTCTSNFVERLDDGNLKCRDRCPFAAGENLEEVKPGVRKRVCVDSCPNGSDVVSSEGICKSSCEPGEYATKDKKCIAASNVCGLYRDQETGASCLEEIVEPARRVECPPGSHLGPYEVACFDDNNKFVSSTFVPARTYYSAAGCEISSCDDAEFTLEEKKVDVRIAPRSIEWHFERTDLSFNRERRYDSCVINILSLGESGTEGNLQFYKDRCVQGQYDNNRLSIRNKVLNAEKLLSGGNINYKTSGLSISSSSVGTFSVVGFDTVLECPDTHEIKPLGSSALLLCLKKGVTNYKEVYCAPPTPFLNVDRCATACPYSYTVDGGICVRSCPSSRPHSYFVDIYNRCVEQCPSGTVPLALFSSSICIPAPLEE